MSLKRALLISRDPAFSWALQRLLEEHSCGLEQVYTLLEAKIRLQRFSYDYYFLDSFKPFEVEMFLQDVSDSGQIFLVDSERSPLEFDRCCHLPKGFPLESVISSLRAHLQP
ncbi:MAG TPA: hypothetical protein PK014_03650 [Thermoanaerobaculia bacterium]|nr:hypothetical protein [Thermoanaerobaculia bacterium]HUM29130.1 hypothetical protein [Thermoanaerobaculia bacterium]HXK67507.1 hypothetical protein [Thermoanaerobaculia bacterium]